MMELGRSFDEVLNEKEVVMFFEKGMTVNDLKALVDEAISKGCGDAIVMVQADADGISDIVVNGFEGCENEFGDGPKIFSITSSENKAQYERCYGTAKENPND